MKTLKIAVGIVVLALIAATGFSLSWLRTHQKIGKPAIKGSSKPGTLVMDIEMPENVLGYASSNIPQQKIVVDTLPKDTSYAARVYWDTNGFFVLGNIILMGNDRSSIHKADYCLAGQGFQPVKKEVVTVTIPGRVPYEMQVAKWTIRGLRQEADGSKREVNGVYVFWFAADGQHTVDNTQRILWYYRDLLTRRTLQRWAYVSYQSFCQPGYEDAAFERMKEVIAASVTEFQTLPGGSTAALAQQ